MQTNRSEVGPPEESADVRRVEVRGGGANPPPFSYNFKGLQTNRSFSLRVRSRNELGWGPYSPPFTFHMFQRGITSEIRVKLSPNLIPPNLLTTLTFHMFQRGTSNL